MGNIMFTVYRVDIMGPQVDLVLGGSEQLTGSQKTQSAVSPVDIMVIRSTGYIAGLKSYI